MQLHIVPVGRPAPQGSKELGGAGQMLEQSPYLPAWRAAIKRAAYETYQRLDIAPGSLPIFPAGTPVTIELCTFYVGPEQCRAEGTDEPLGAPDVDKLLRAVLDALGGANKRKRDSARLYADDSQVVSIKNLSKQRTISATTGAYIVVSDGRE